MTTEREDHSWRRHEVPTYTEAQDTWLFGLSFRQLIWVAVGGGLGYGAYQFVWFLPFFGRVGLGVIVLLLTVMFVAIRPGGRSFFAVTRELLAYQFGSKHYSDLTRHLVTTEPVERFRPQRRRKTVTIPIPLPNNTKYISLRLPVGGRGAKTSALLIVVGASLFSASGCMFAQGAEAQGIPHYIGKRVYLQAVVVDFKNDKETASVYMKAAAPLRWASPRVAESVQSALEAEAHSTAVNTALKDDGSVFVPLTAIPVEEEFAFENISLSDREKRIRPFCNVPLRYEQFGNVEPDGRIGSFRQDATDCRIVLPDKIPGTLAEYGISSDFSVSKPDIAVQWEDSRRNKGSLNVEGSFFPFPKPTKSRILQKLVHPVLSTGGSDVAELLNPREMCDTSKIQLRSLGVQSEASGLVGASEYFDGLGGRRLAGVVEMCPLEDSGRKARVLLPEMAVFADGNDDFEIRVRAVVESETDADVTNTAKLDVLEPSGSIFKTIASLVVPLSGQSGYAPELEGAFKFNVPIDAFTQLTKTIGTERDEIRFALRLAITHEVKVKRPVHQPVDFYSQLLVEHIESCSCSRSGSCRCRGTGNSCSRSGNVSCRSSQTMKEYEYYPDHYRVDAANREYLPTDESSVKTFTFTQTIRFEPTVVAFERPFAKMVYVEPTPRPAYGEKKDYHQAGDFLGYLGGFNAIEKHEVICGPGVSTVAGTPTPWIWVEPGVNSQGAAYGGCRQNFICKLDIPWQEEPFGADGLPTEEDYKCLRE